MRIQNRCRQVRHRAANHDALIFSCDSGFRFADRNSNFPGRFRVVIGCRRRYDNVGFAVRRRDLLNRQFTVGSNVDVIPAAVLHGIGNGPTARGGFGHAGANSFVGITIGGSHVRRGNGLRSFDLQGDGHCPGACFRLISTGRDCRSSIRRIRGQAHAGEHPQQHRQCEDDAQKSLCFHIHTSL